MSWLALRLASCAAAGGLCVISAAGEFDLNAAGLGAGPGDGGGAVLADAPTANTARDGNIAIVEEYDMAVRQNTIAAYELFIMRHPSHANAELARQRIRILRGATSND